MRTILVVDDDDWVRVFVRDALAAEGYRVLEAADGAAAIRIAAEHPGPIHLLLTDVVMPGMNGGQLAAELAGRRYGLKVMFMSAYDRDFLAAHGFDPVAPVVTKPFTIEYLARRVRTTLADRGAAAPVSPFASRSR
jgi:two-component system cell cycle sensor histidine kinase/response regulator CckA